MPRKMLPVIVMAVLCGAASVPLCASGSTTDDIRAVIQTQQKAWNQGDIDGFMNGYANATSTAFVSEDKVTRGWQTVRDRYKKKYPDRAKMGTLIFSGLQIKPLSPDCALALGSWKLKRAGDRPHGKFTLIFRRLPEGWRIVHDHTSAAK